MKNRFKFLFVPFMLALSCTNQKPEPHVGLYRTFEIQLENTKPYDNKFTDVDLTCEFRSPTGKSTKFGGFFDGDGNGGGNQTTGAVWKIRFMPDEPGEWSCQWRWNDGTPGWSGQYVRAWERPHLQLARPTTETDSIEQFGVLELLLLWQYPIDKIETAA